MGAPNNWTRSEILAQANLNEAAADAATEYFARLKRLPRWRRELVQRLAPAYPLVVARPLTEVVYVSTPLLVPPGVVMHGWNVQPAPES